MIECMTAQPDLDKLRLLSRGRVLEIGTFVGGTTIVLLERADHVVTVDSFTGKHDGSRERDDYVWEVSQLETARRNLQGRPVTILQYDTTLQREELCEALASQTFDVVFIDGNHEYGHVKNDLEIAKQFLAENGTICGHDWQMDGVKHAVKEELGYVHVLTREPGEDGVGSLWWKDESKMTRDEIAERLGRQPTEREIEVFNGVNAPKTLQDALLRRFNKTTGVRPLARPFGPAASVGAGAKSPLHLEMRANGIGDVVLGLLATGGAKRKYPNAEIVYHCRNHEWAKLFTGYDQLAPMDWNKPYKDSLQINDRYGEECRLKSPVPRWKRYCQNAGVEVPVTPRLKDHDDILQEGERFKGFVALCIKSCYNNRNWPHFRQLEELLMDEGYKTVIIHNNMKDCVGFKGVLAVGWTPRQVCSVLLNCDTVIGPDSGLAHLAAVLGKKPLILCGPCLASKIYYNPVVEVTGSGGIDGKNCTGCYWQHPYNSRCDKGCFALASISPEDVMERIKAPVELTTIPNTIPPKRGVLELTTIA